MKHPERKYEYKEPVRVLVVKDPNEYEGIDSEVVIAIVLLILIIVTGI